VRRGGEKYKLALGKMEKEQFHAIGKRLPRKDGIAKVTGQEIYASDVVLPRMLYGRILRSPYPHARVKSIDTSAAEKTGAVCITFKDVPRSNTGAHCQHSQGYRKDRQVLTGHPLHVGEAIAAVAAETEELADKALSLIRVDYEKYSAVFDAVEAMRPGSPLLHETIKIGDEEQGIENNIAVTKLINQGDVEKGFKEADVVTEEEFKTGRVYHAQMETKSVVCQPEADGGITVWTTTRHP
jgi:xanthine dehydrogenase molybdenum-binding subunit